MAAKTKESAKRKTTAAKAKPAARKKVVAKKAATPKRSAPAIKEPLTKSQLQAELAEATDLSKKQVATLMDELADLIERHVKSRGAGEFTLPGLLKIRAVRKPATKARKGTNPFTGEETTFAAKPARNVVKIKALKKLKDMVA